MVPAVAAAVGHDVGPALTVTGGLKAAVRLGVYRVGVLVLPFKRVWALLGLTPVPDNATGPEACTDLARDIGWSVRACGQHLPWGCKCLVQAVACYSMLRRRGICSTVHLGLAKDEEAGLRAHAWLICGGIELTGAREAGDFTEISAFSSPR